MNVAIVINTSWNIYNFRKGLIQSLLLNGYKVTAIAPHDQFSDLLREIGCTFIPLKMDSRGANAVRDLQLIFELYGIYKKCKPDVILHYTIKPNIYGTLAAAMLQLPVINNVSGLGTIFLNKGASSFIARFLYKFSFRFPAKVFFQNPDDQKLFIDLQLVNPKITDLLPGSGIDPEYFKPISKQSQKGETMVFLMISRIIRDKGIVEFLDAAGQLKKSGIKADFRILGVLDPQHSRGIGKSEFEQKVQKNGAIYLGNAHDVRKFIADSDCVVLPSYREGTPRTLLEAASMGKPLIATDVPGCNEVLKAGYNGLKCEARNAGDLAKAMLEMTRLPLEKRNQMGENSRKLILERFDERYVSEKYLSAIKEILN